MARRTLLLPGEGQGPELASWRPLLAFVVALGWLVVRSSVLPRLGLHRIPFDPLVPLAGAFALYGRPAEAWIVGLSIGWLADTMAGRESGRILLPFAAFVALTMPVRGRVVLRDSLVPAIGVALTFALGSSLGSLALFVLDAGPRFRLFSLVRETGGVALATLVLWPRLRRLAGADDDRTMLWTGAR